MTEQNKFKLSWLFVVLALTSGVFVFSGDQFVAQASDHEDIKALRESGKVMPFNQFIDSLELQGAKVIEAKLEQEHGRMVYEIEVLEPNGKIYEHYYDAVTGELIKSELED